MPKGVYKHKKGIFKHTDEWKAASGALHTIHGHTRKGVPYSSEYNSWRGMIRRCRNSKAHNYRWYGARGINVCDRWLKFSNFIADMGLKPESKMTLERINNDVGYEPENCRWATHKDQMQSRRRPWSFRTEVARA